MRRSIIPLLLIFGLLLSSAACSGNDSRRMFNVEFKPPSVAVLTFATDDNAIRFREIKVFEYISEHHSNIVMTEEVEGSGKTYILNFPFGAGKQYFIRYRDFFNNVYSSWYLSDMFTY